jgi:hypothetical protein
LSGSRNISCGKLWETENPDDVFSPDITLARFNVVQKNDNLMAISLLL